MTTIDQVIRAVEDETGKDAASDSKLSDLVADSLEFTSLLVRIESEFGVEIPDAMVPDIHTVDDLLQAIRKESGRTHDVPA
jgi:acyl carrier protein